MGGSRVFLSAGRGGVCVASTITVVLTGFIVPETSATDAAVAVGISVAAELCGSL